MRSNYTYGSSYWIFECKQLATFVIHFSWRVVAYNYYLQDTREDLRLSMAKDAADIQTESIHIDEGPKCNETLNSNGEQSTTLLGKELLYDFQRKISLFKNEQLETGSAASLDKRTSHGSLLGMWTCLTHYVLLLHISIAIPVISYQDLDFLVLLQYQNWTPWKYLIFN